MWLAKVPGLFPLAMLMVIAGCASAPPGQRLRIVDIPLAARQADLIFTITSGTRLKISCDSPGECRNAQSDEVRRRFILQVERIANTLQQGALKRYPDLAQRSPSLAGGHFDVHVVTGNDPGSDSSPSGRIAINEAFATWQADDGFVAFVIAREMGHVIARHDEENSSSSMIASLLLNIILPGSGIVKSAISTIGSRIVSISKREEQATEADGIAHNLLKASNFPLSEVARSLLITSASLDDGGWSKGFRKSSELLVADSRAAEIAAVAVNKGKNRATPEKPARLIAANR